VTVVMLVILSVLLVRGFLFHDEESAAKVEPACYGMFLAVALDVFLVSFTKWLFGGTP
jgi:hypothetical protein